ncbi:hypothetical protein R1flu_018978 [Riccia fluitans]|uniref:Uncharacterized protein n=1 Tax=Riccia fluitans TaxID=41844 RepID=A0ABD1ZHD6_9MARC
MKRTTCSNVVPPNMIRDMVDGRSASKGQGRSTGWSKDGAIGRGSDQLQAWVLAEDRADRLLESLSLVALPLLLP